MMIMPVMYSDEAIDSAIATTSKQLGYNEGQRRICVRSNWKWELTMLCGLCLLPYAFDILRCGEGKSTVLVVVSYPDPTDVRIIAA